MFYNPEVFIYLMLLPVVFLLIIPALLTTMRFMIGVLKSYQMAKAEERFEQEIIAEA